MNANTVPTDCPRCRALSRPPRLTFRYLLARGREEILGPDRGLLLTLWRLLISPREVIEAFLRDDDRRFFGPFKFFVVSTAASILLMPNLPLLDGALANGLGKNGVFPSTELAQAWVTEWNGLLYAPLLLFLAVALRLFFRARGLNLAEHLVIATYGWSQMLIIATAAFGLVAALKALGLRGVILLPLLFASTLYWFWFCAHVYRIRTLADWVRCLVCVPAALGLYFFGALGAIAAWVWLAR